MSMALDEVTREAIQLPRHQRLALARISLELDDSGTDVDVEAAWDAEIQARVRAVEEGRVECEPGSPSGPILRFPPRGGNSLVLRDLQWSHGTDVGCGMGNQVGTAPISTHERNSKDKNAKVLQNRF